MSKADQDHFKDYREQTRVKHAILADYLPVYFNILKSWSRNLVYIDGFAGAGAYEGEDGKLHMGSPLLALDLIASRDFHAQVSTIFVESRPDHFENLKRRVEEFYADHSHIREPHTERGTFEACVGEILAQLKGNIAPTFLFVDPCGVAGTDFATIKRVMDSRSCEAFIFFNVDGVRRILGLKELGATLPQLLASAERANALHADIQQLAAERSERSTNVDVAAEIIMRHFKRALVEGMGVEFVTPFRVEFEQRRLTSHYLVHATKNETGFALMKDVMWRVGRRFDGGNAMELAQASHDPNVSMLFRQAAPAEDDILAGTTADGICVDEFFQRRVRLKDNDQCEAAYKAAVIALEEEGRILVFDKLNEKPMPASKRRPNRQTGKPTIGAGYYLRLKPAEASRGA